MDWTLVITHPFKWHAVCSQPGYSWTCSDSLIWIRTKPKFFASTHIKIHVAILIKMANAALKVSASCYSDYSNGESWASTGVLYQYWDYEKMWQCIGLHDGRRKQTEHRWKQLGILCVHMGEVNKYIEAAHLLSLWKNSEWFFPFLLFYYCCYIVFAVKTRFLKCGHVQKQWMQI